MGWTEKPHDVVPHPPGCTWAPQRFSKIEIEWSVLSISKEVLGLSYNKRQYSGRVALQYFNQFPSSSSQILGRMNWLITQDEVYGMCSGGASGLPAVEDLPVNETDMRWLELEARFGFCEKEILSISQIFSHKRTWQKKTRAKSQAICKTSIFEGYR